MGSRNTKDLFSRQTQLTFGIRLSVEHRECFLHKTQSVWKEKKKKSNHHLPPFTMNINRAQPENLQHAEKNRKQHKILPFVCWCLLQQ